MDQSLHPAKPNPTSVKLSASTISVGAGATDSSVTFSVEPAGTNQECKVTVKDASIATVIISGNKLSVKGVKVEGGTTTAEVASIYNEKIKSTVTITVNKTENK